MNIKPIMAGAAWLALGASAPSLAASFAQGAVGLVVHPERGAVKEVRLELMRDNIIRFIGLAFPPPTTSTTPTARSATTATQPQSNAESFHAHQF